MDSYIRAPGLVLYPYVLVAGPNKHDILSGILVRTETSSARSDPPHPLGGGVVDDGHPQRHFQLSFGSSVLRELLAPQGGSFISSCLGGRFCLHWSRSRGALLAVRYDRGNLYESNVWFKCAVCRVGLFFSCKMAVMQVAFLSLGKRLVMKSSENEGDHRA